MSYELELMILKKLEKNSEISRKELYEDVINMYKMEHNATPATSNFSHSLSDLMSYDIIEVNIDKKDTRKRYFRLTKKGETYLGSLDIYHKGLLSSLVHYDEFYPKHVGKLIDLEEELKTLRKINFEGDTLNKIAENIKRKDESKKHPKGDKISLPVLGYLSLHATSKLRNRAQSEGKEVSNKKFSSSSEALESLANDEIAIIPSIPATTLKEWMENNGELDRFIGDRTFLELCNYIISDKSSYKSIKRGEKKPEVYSTASSPVREAIAENIGKDYVEDKDSVKAFHENAGSGVCLITENPAIAYALSDYNVIAYIEPAYFLINPDLCYEDTRTIKKELNDRNMVTQLNIHRALTNPNTSPVLDYLLEKGLEIKE